jgi:hypothetical protein
MPASLPEPELIRRKADEVLARPEYLPDAVADESRGLLALVLDAFEWVVNAIRGFVTWLQDLPAGVQWIVKVGLSLALVALVAHIMYTLVKAARAPRRAGVTLEEAVRIKDPHALEGLADEAVARGDYIAAIRFLFRASILRLENIEQRLNRPGATNRELLRRYRATPVYESLQLFVDTIDAKWYGEQSCSQLDYAVCRDAYRHLTSLAIHAAGPAATATSRNEGA